MNQSGAVLALLLLACAAIAAAQSPRALLQGRSDQAPGHQGDQERGQPEEVAAIAAQLGGPNVGKFLVPGAASKFARHSFIVETGEATPKQVEELLRLVKRRGALKVTDLSGPAFTGFALRLHPGQAQQAAVLQRLIDAGAVTMVESDMVVEAVQLTQTGATWGLDRVDQRILPLSGNYTYGYQATDVIAYIIDTGILVTHDEFQHADGTSRASIGGDFISNPPLAAGDCNGHGTHVAGTVGGKTYGVAKNVNLVSLRVLDCKGSGSTSGVISGINAAVTQCAKRRCVANMSLGGGFSSALNSAVSKATSAGVVFVVAAGNSNAQACNESPASEPTAITVAATTSADARASYSNYGSCVDIFAPGSSITSAWYTDTTAINTISGTSMASPHVAGVAALALSVRAAAPVSRADVAAVSAAIFNTATAKIVTRPGPLTPNRLLFSPIRWTGL